MEQEQKFKKMTGEPVGKLIMKLAIPCIISMLVTAFYNMADTFFVGRLNSNAATGAVGVVFSMMSVIQAIGFFFGHGSGNYISRCLGRKNYKEASNMAATGFFSSLGIGIIICIFGQLFLEPLSLILGSTETILPYTKDYLKFILLGAPWMTSSIVLNNQLRFQGSAVYSMVGITLGAVLNIALDPIFIFTLKMGVAGAGLATSLSQFISFLLLLYGTSKGENIHIHIKNFKFKVFYYKTIVAGGLPSLARQGLSSFAAICLNLSAGAFGDSAIAAMSVVQRIMMFGASAMIGFGQGFQPVCGFNFGAKLYDRVKKGFWFCVKVSFFFLLGVGAIGFIFAPQIISVFRNDAEVIAFGTAALRFQFCTFPLHSWIVMANMMEQSMGRTIPATFLGGARQGIFFIPTILIFSALFGAVGVQSAQAMADLLTFLSAIPIHIYVMKTMNKGKTL
ncbi:MAG: MATE family efflux transporter [Clostridia bacterium]|nr:MATE family efflux transporter [Clostridia bacterium]